jgi:hypothetical protein
LALATTAIDVHPPRAGRLWRFQLAYWRIWHAVARLATKPIPGLNALGSFSNRVETTHFDLPTLLRCIIPGWPQYHRGDRPRGFVFLFGYFALLLPALILTGTGLGSLLLGLAVAFHIAAVCDAVVTAFATPADRIAFTAATALAVCLGAYVPAGWLISRVATPISINATIPPFQQGEVLWYNRWAEPALGDLVVYTLPGIRVAGRMAAGANAQFVFQGPWIGRVVALPGQTVAVGDGVWFVDGLKCRWQSADIPAMRDANSWIVPHDHAFVLPEGLVQPGAQISFSELQAVYLVPNDRIGGRLYFRSLPLSQWSRLQ